MPQETTAGVYRAAFLRTLPEFLKRYPGLDVVPLLAAAGIDPSLPEPEAMNDLSKGIIFLEQLSSATGDPCVGMELAAQVPWSDLGILGYVLLHSPTLGAAFSNAARYFAVQQTQGRILLESGPERVHLAYVLEDGPRPYHQQAEIVLTMLVRLAREATTEAGWSPREVLLTRDGGGGRERIERFFGAKVRFGAERDELLLRAEDLALPLVRADAGLLPILLRHADDCLASMTPAGDFISRVRRVVLRGLESGDPSLPVVASELACSVRSLQRRLSEEGTSFKEVVEETRRTLSLRYLEDPSISLTEAAFLLGYSDLSAFSRAFRRWTGKSALAVRRGRGAASAV